eukprot:PhF_6_TR60/c0_g1_i1/m.57
MDAPPCCYFLRGSCRRSNKCQYSHKDDDHKTPCSFGASCTQGHASRVTTALGTAPAKALGKNQGPTQVAGKAPPPPPPPVALAWTGKILKLIIDGNNFWHAATVNGGNKHKQVATALRATVDHFQTVMYPGIKVEGVWVDLDAYEYIKFLDNEVKDVDVREGMKKAA